MNKTKFHVKTEWRKFGFILGIILAVIATVLLMKSRETYIYFYGASFFFILAGLLFPILLKPVYILFMYISEGLGWVMTRLILGTLFYLMITPMSLIGRLMGKKFLDLQFPGQEKSYWLESGEPLDKREHRYENQF